MDPVASPGSRGCRPVPATAGLEAAGLLLALLACGCYQKPELAPLQSEKPTSEPIPVIWRVEPCSGPAAGGTSSAILGTGFRPGVKVLVGGREAAVAYATADAIGFVTPPGAEGGASVEAVNADGTRARAEHGFTFGQGPPRIFFAGPDKAPLAGGTPLYVHGSGFTAGAAVLVNGAACVTVLVGHGGLIVAQVPPGASGPAAVEVRNPSGGSALLEGAMTYVDLASGDCLVRGLVEFEKRQVTPAGLTGSYSPAPLPGVEVEIHVDDSPLRVVTCWADRCGRFAAAVRPGPALTARVRVLAKACASPPALSALVMDNSNDRAVYAMETQTFAIPPGLVVDRTLTAPAEAPSIAGAFNLLSVCVGSALKVRDETGAELPLLRIFWEPGNGWVVWSSAFYTADLGSGPVPVMQVLGGYPGIEDSTDTDEFDDAVISHEYGHFVQWSLSTDSSPGGQHGGEMLVPNLAFSEGFASWFGSACRGSPDYRDTTGRGEEGMMLLEFSAESVPFQLPVVRGIGSEETVLEVLWDLFDGGEVPDPDGDGQALGFAPVLSAVASFDASRDYPCLYTFFEKALLAGSLDEAGVAALSRFPEDQGFSWPPPQGGGFPARLSVPGAAEDFVDALNPYHPAEPSWKFWLSSSLGNPFNPMNGFNSRRYFSFELGAPREVTITLEVRGSGEASENPDLYLLDLRNTEIDSSRTDSPVERIQRTLGAGTYILEVRGFRYVGLNYVRLSAASFRLSVE